MSTGYAFKASWRDKENIERFAELHGIGRNRTFFFTLTFRQNVTNKGIANKMWHNLRTQIQHEFKDFRFLLVWERQARGAWHCHALCHCPTAPSLNKFVRFVEGFVRVSRMKYGFVNARWTSGKDFKGIAYYMGKYLTKEKREKGVRYVSYSSNWARKVRMPFSFVGGKSAEWRKNCASLHEELGTFFSCFYKSARFDWVRDAVLTRSASLVRQWVSKNEILGRLLAVKDEMNTPAYKEETLYREVLKSYNKRERFLNYELNY